MHFDAAVAAGEVMHEGFEDIAGIVGGDADVAEVAAVPEPVDEILEGEAAFEGLASAVVGAADDVLDGNGFPIERRGEKEAAGIDFPAFGEARGAADHIDIGEHPIPIFLGHFAFEERFGDVADPLLAFGVEAGHFFEPSEEGFVVGGFSFEDEELILGCGEIGDELAARGIGGFSALDAVGGDDGVFAGRGIAVGAAWFVFSAGEIGADEGGAGEFLDGGGVAFHFLQGFFGGHAQEFGEGIGDTGEAEGALERGDGVVGESFEVECGFGIGKPIGYRTAESAPGRLDWTSVRPPKLSCSSRDI
jgi:hypothetical protein